MTRLLVVGLVNVLIFWAIAMTLSAVTGVSVHFTWTMTAFIFTVGIVIDRLTARYKDDR